MNQLPTICLVCEDKKGLEVHLQVHRTHQERLQTLISSKVSEIIALPAYYLNDTPTFEQHHTLLFELSYLKWQRETNESSFRNSYNLLMVTCICRIVVPDICNCFHCLLKCANDMPLIECPSERPAERPRLSLAMVDSFLHNLQQAEPEPELSQSPKPKTV
jgi:hypothetical protein